MPGITPKGEFRRVRPGRAQGCPGVEQGLGVAWSRDGTVLATTCQDQKIYLWDTAARNLKCSLVGSANGGLRAAFDPTGTVLASNGWESRLWLWDPVLGRSWLNLSGATGAEFCEDGRIVVAREDQLTTHQIDPALEYRSFARSFGERINYGSASVRRDGRVLAVGTDRGVALWDLARGTELPFLPIGVCRHVLFEASGDLITSGRAVGVRRWPVRLDPKQGEFHIGPPFQLLLPGGICGIAEDRQGRIVALANANHAYVTTPERPMRVGRLDDCRYIAVSPDGNWLATGNHDTTGAQIWSLRDGAHVTDLPVKGVVRVAFSPDGRLLMTSPPPCTLWAVGAWREERRIIGGEGRCFSPDGRLLVVTDQDKALRLVETGSGRTVARLRRAPDYADIATSEIVHPRRCAPGGNHQ